MSKKGGSDRAAKLIEDKTFGLKNKSQFARALLTSSQDMLNHPHPPLPSHATRQEPESPGIRESCCTHGEGWPRA
jgi:hypothetical protein